MNTDRLDAQIAVNVYCVRFARIIHIADTAFCKTQCPFKFRQ
ncbi:Uncharacterised protein [Vibrio cholerae]|nr:Uncharacterised protein [Vibrio cholerae]